ncbi:unnamed protein product [Ceratitis capitata]|uniref:(Mediterranean fruit fly) hypothetical protein n=1 Tax=Ceratitis capitata TaxID=7213 RepID=A0A811UGJ0_CERCA|nr:unnamed protein product [Ceratitis capitata]
MSKLWDSKSQTKIAAWLEGKRSQLNASKQRMGFGSRKARIRNKVTGLKSCCECGQNDSNRLSLYSKLWLRTSINGSPTGRPNPNGDG